MKVIVSKVIANVENAFTRETCKSRTVTYVDSHAIFIGLYFYALFHEATAINFDCTLHSNIHKATEWNSCDMQAFT